MAYRTDDRAFFVYGFAKNERENIEDDELQTLRDIGAELLGQDDASLHAAVDTGALQELGNGEEN